MVVKQGEPLSPFSFFYFINDMSTYLHDNAVVHITIEELLIFLLMFADDTVIFRTLKRDCKLISCVSTVLNVALW